VDRNFVLIISTSRVPRCSNHRSASPTPPLEPTKKPTAPTSSISLALVSHRKPHNLIFYLCLSSSKSPLRQCSRFYHPFLSILIFPTSLLYKNPKWTINFGIFLALLIIPPRHVGLCMRSPRRNILPNCHQWQEHPDPSIPWSLDDIERYIKGSRCKWVDKFSHTQEKPPIPPMWHVKFGTNHTHLEILKLKISGFQFIQYGRSTQSKLIVATLASSP
jgi:hypothetical protein